MRFTEQRMFGYVKCVLLGRMHGSWMLLITERKLFCFLILSFCFIFRITLHIWISSRVCQTSEFHHERTTTLNWIFELVTYFTCFLPGTAHVAELNTIASRPRTKTQFHEKKVKKRSFLCHFELVFLVRLGGGRFWPKTTPPAHPPQADKHHLRTWAKMKVAVTYFRASHGVAAGCAFRKSRLFCSLLMSKDQHSYSFGAFSYFAATVVFFYFLNLSHV